MKITLFSGNQPRHLNLAKQLSLIAEEVHFVSEVNTVFPLAGGDFLNKSDTMREYLTYMIKAENFIFGNIGFLPKNVRTLALMKGDLNLVSQPQLVNALKSDIYIVFGASYIKGWLIDFLIEKEALNIHMGISPYYRGSACNFWALYDKRPSYVGATIHMLSKGLDNGDILFHCTPKLIDGDTSFNFTMRSVAAAHDGLVESIDTRKIFLLPRIKQSREFEIRYTKVADFNDEIVREFLEGNMDIQDSEIEYPYFFKPLHL